MLEVLAGVGRFSHLSSWILIGVRFDAESVVDADPAMLPRRWRTYPPPASVQSLGDEWILGASSVALKVPSAIVPAEHNYVLNPRHPAFETLEIGPEEIIALDPRLTRPSPPPPR
jgi:RES domain-containing protein